MELVNIERVNEVYIRVRTESGIKMELSKHFEFEVPGAKFSPAYRNKIWDGKIRLFSAMTGMIYAGLLPHIVKFCATRDYECEVDAQLKPDESVQDTAGYDLAKEFDAIYEPRDYQNNAIVHALKNNRSLLLSPTASGKSLIIYLLSRFHAEQGRRVLIVVPTISLVTQMATDFVEYNKNRPLNIHKIMGVLKRTLTLNTLSLLGNLYSKRRKTGSLSLTWLL